MFVVCLALAILYTVGLFYFGNPLGGWTIEFWLVAIPVFIAFIAVMGIGAWIGWTMATTPPPPTPIEEIESEIEKEEEAASESKAEETKEAEKPETSKETKTQRRRRKGRTPP